MKSIHLIGVSLFAMVATSPAFAQTEPQSADDDTSGDIIVTATKREQTLQDVPISVSVTSSETVEKAQIRDLIDLQTIVPSLKVSQLNATGQTNFTIRGFGNGNGNDGIESSVGVFIDGVYRARTSAALDDLPEIERVEVLRGPQSTLFGKNVSAGAISIVTKKPQFKWGGKAEISLGNYGLINPRASITGPITESIAFRVSGSVNMRDGYFFNTTTKGEANNRNRWSLRADILFEPSSDFSVRVIGDYAVIKELCCGVTGIRNGPATLAIGRPTTDPQGGLGKPISNTSQIFSRNIVFDANPQNRLVGKGLSGQIDWNLGFAKLTSITAYRNQVNQSNQDIDFTGADIASNKTANEISTFTQEFRLASDNDGPFNWLVGGFYQNEDLDTARDIRFGNDIRAFANSLTGGSAGLLFLLESLQQATNPAIVPGRTYFQAGQGILDAYKLKQESYSLFGQADYKVTDRLTVTGGLAYLHDRKAATSNVVMNDPFSALDLNNVAGLGFLPFAALPAPIQGCLVGLKGFTPGATIPTNLFGGSLGASLPNATNVGSCASPALVNPFNLNGVQFFYGDTANHGPVNFPNANESGVFTGSKVTYAARVAYDFDIVNAYVSYSTGWKATAVNLSSDSRPPTNGVGRSAAPEEVTVYEAGLKGKFRGGFFNVAVFKQEIKGFQSNGFTGLGYALVNAGKQSVKGFEVDAAYSPARWLSLTGAVTYLDGKYDSFVAAPCFSYDTVNCPRNAQGILTPSRNLTGRRPAGVPEWSGSVSATLSQNLTDRLSGYFRAEFDYTSDTYLSETTPENLATYGQSNVNLSLGFEDRDAQLEVMGWVRNLTNDDALLATFPTVAQGFPEPASYSGYPNQPRTYGVTLRKTF